MGVSPDLQGERFGFWTVESNCYGNLWWCRCECGERRAVRADYLRRELSTSCGCHGKDWCRTHGRARSPIYGVWAAMIQRCHNPDSRSYPLYGGRGIAVCQRWRNSFENFLADMGEKPAGRMSIGRIDNDRGYELGNCRWETWTQQIRNRRVTPMLTVNGITKSAAEWAAERGLNFRRVQDRVRRGLTGEDALSPDRHGRWGKTSKRLA